jgi:SAM-dependent methyltransferase
MTDGVSCRICGCRSFSLISYPGPNLTSAIHPHLFFDAIAECQNCGLGIALPVPTQAQLDRYYASGAYWHASGSSKAQLAHERNQGRHRVAQCLAHFEQAGAVADIGAGHGAIAEWLDRLAHARVLGYDFIEPDASSREWILARRTRFPLRSAATIRDLGRDYALVFLDHVLEHVADPIDFLGGVCERLRPGGVAYVETPHSDQRFKDDVFPHTLFFTPTALRRLAERLELEVLECSAFGAYPGTEGGVSSATFRWFGAAFHAAARVGVRHMEQWLDDLIWRYAPTADGMWLRCVMRRPA